MVLRAVLMKSGLVSINTARQNISKIAVSVNTARQVNTAHSKTTVNAARPIKAFRVFNSRTRIVEESLHIRFSENTSIVLGSGPDWLFDIYALTRTMNYEPIIAGTQSNGFADKNSESNDQEKEDNVNSTNNVNAASINKVNVVGAKTSIELPFDPNMPALEDYSIFDFIRDDEDDGVVADMNNLDTTIQVSPILTTRIHKIILLIK
ncbi:hypothetical protein Tco_1555482 [Tanacetum coccineum]